MNWNYCIFEDVKSVVITALLIIIVKHYQNIIH